MWFYLEPARTANVCAGVGGPEERGHAAVVRGEIHSQPHHLGTGELVELQVQLRQVDPVARSLSVGAYVFIPNLNSRSISSTISFLISSGISLW